VSERANEYSGAGVSEVGSAEQANERADEQMAQCSTYRFHSLSTHRAGAPYKSRVRVFLRGIALLNLFDIRDEFPVSELAGDPGDVTQGLQRRSVRHVPRPVEFRPTRAQVVARLRDAIHQSPLLAELVENVPPRLLQARAASVEVEARNVILVAPTEFAIEVELSHFLRGFFFFWEISLNVFEAVEELVIADAVSPRELLAIKLEVGPFHGRYGGRTAIALSTANVGVSELAQVISAGGGVTPPAVFRAGKFYSAPSDILASRRFRHSLSFETP